MRVAVAQDPEGKTGLIELQAEQLWYIETNKKIKDMVVVHMSQNECYYAPGTLKFWETALKASGLLFEKVDRTNVLHLPLVKYMDEYYNTYFEDSRTKDSKYCTVSVANAKFVRDYLNKNKSKLQAY
ncbi:hypothetical protein [Cohnella sp. REN36]|uniref:hypothetical protein n=1 Tax=Cohnella sp. REN36 TaxID=2887347 RepID=UPI001D140A34|nr:hypothetical protein [Cohnella sp. REN36]MCC3377161.1 hypothetical protein [Cohnella sp. REN36]